jgi:hypothetical protein
VTATAVLSVATTLVTLSLERRRRARRTPAEAQIPSTTAKPPAGQGDVLSSHQHLTGYDMHRADSR